MIAEKGKFWRCMPLLLLLTLPAVVHAQFTFYTNADNTITITGYTNPSGALIIPDTINSLPVTTINDEAFRNYNDLTSVTIGINVTSIGNMGFFYCTSLTNIAFSQSVTNIGASAFYGCYSLTSITIPDKITSIAPDTFYACSSLTNVTIPNSVTIIEMWAFAGCSSLTNITIPNSVTNIGDLAFRGCGLTSLTIPNSVTYIGSHVFEYCLSLANIVVSDQVKSIGASLFHSCRSLTNVVIGTNVASIGYAAFQDCTSLPRITIPASITNIETDAFLFCTGLTNVSIGSSVASIGSAAFFSCTNLIQVMIPASVSSIGIAAFAGCSSLNAIMVDVLNQFFSSVNGVLVNKSQTTLVAYPGGKSGNYTISSNVTHIESYAFAYCTSLTGVMIPNSVTDIGESAFTSCTSLTGVTIPNNATNIGNGAFAGCTSMTAIEVDGANPAFSSVGGVLFDKSQTTLVGFPGGIAGNYTVPKSVTIIGDYAFHNCTNLIGIYFPSNAPSANYTAFEGDNNYTTAYYLPGTTGQGGFTTWNDFSAHTGLPVVLWNPQAQTSDASFGVRTNKFGFTITGSSNLVIVVEACTNLTQPVWSPLQTNTLTGGSAYFSDPQWTNPPARFYRLRSP